MAMVAAGLNTPIGKVDKEEVREGVNYLGGIWGRVVVLVELSVGPMELFWWSLQTSSHQLMVEVTGSQ